MIVRGGVVARRACDRCGASREALPGVFRVISGRWICNWHTHYTSVEQADSVPYRTFSAKPIKDPRPFSIRPSHEAAESEILNFLIEHWNYTTVDRYNGSGTGATNYTFPRKNGPSKTTDTDGYIFSTAWAGVYAAKMLDAADRPASMLASASTLLRSCADHLCARQVHGPLALNGLTMAIDGQSWDGTYNATSFFPASNVTTWGMFAERMLPTGFPVAGECLWYAWRRFGDEKYKRCAIAIATAVRSMQRPDLNGGANAFVNVSPRSNMITSNTRFSTWNVGSQVSADCYPSSLRALVLWKMIKDDIGDIAIGNGYDANYLTADNSATISQAAAELIEAWTTAKAGVVGFSTSTPFDQYKVDTATWSAKTGNAVNVIDVWEWALGLSGLYAWSGMTSTVSTIFDWLLTFGSTDFDPDAYDDDTLLSSMAGVHSPGVTGFWTRALNTSTMVNAASVNNTVDAIQMSTSGVLAEIFAARRPDLVAAMKNALDVYSVTGIRADKNRHVFRGTRRLIGLSYQVSNNSENRSPWAAAQLGNLYRVEPKTPITVTR